MFYQQKRTIASMISGILILTAYGIHAWRTFREGTVDMGNDLRYWAITMLIFIGIGIVATIVIQIIFHIINAVVNEVTTGVQDEDQLVQDEMDKLVELKATRNGYVVAGLGFVSAMLTLVLRLPPGVMLNVLYLSFALGSIFEGASQLYYYRRGI
jgi:hypothetical protein